MRTPKVTILPIAFVAACFIIAIPAEDSKIEMEISKNKSAEFSQLLKDLLKGYDKLLRPYFGGKAAKITVNMYVVTLGKFNEVLGTYKLKMYLRQSWKDPRLAFGKKGADGFITLSSRIVDQIWAPDTYFVNEDTAMLHQITSKNQLIYLYPDGTLLLSARLSITADCLMILKDFPMDSQRCSLSFQSYGYSNSEVDYFWQSDRDPTQNVIMSKDTYNNPTFIYQEVQSQRLVSDYGAIGNWTQLKVNVKMKRKMGYFAMHVFIPSILLVLISWVSFWIHEDQTAARCGLGITTGLALTTIISGVQSTLPKVSYIKAIDWFLIICLITVFASLIEYAFVHYTGKKRKKQRAALNKGLDELCKTMDTEPFSSDRPYNVRKASAYAQGATVQCKIAQPFKEFWNSHFNTGKDEDPGDAVNKIDKYARIMFPVCFLGLNSIYWIGYMIRINSEVE